MSPWPVLVFGAGKAINQASWLPAADPFMCRALTPWNSFLYREQAACAVYAGVVSLCSLLLLHLSCLFSLVVSFLIKCLCWYPNAPTSSDAGAAMQGCSFSKTKSCCHGFPLKTLPGQYFKEQTEPGKKVLSIRTSVWISALGHSLWTIWGEKLLFTKTNERTLPKARAAAQSGHVSESRLSKASSLHPP